MSKLSIWGLKFGLTFLFVNMVCLSWYDELLNMHPCVQFLVISTLSLEFSKLWSTSCVGQRVVKSRCVFVCLFKWSKSCLLLFLWSVVNHYRLRATKAPVLPNIDAPACLLFQKSVLLLETNLNSSSLFLTLMQGRFRFGQLVPCYQRLSAFKEQHHLVTGFHSSHNKIMIICHRVMHLVIIKLCLRLFFSSFIISLKYHMHSNSSLTLM